MPFSPSYGENITNERFISANKETSLIRNDYQRDGHGGGTVTVVEIKYIIHKLDYADEAWYWAAIACVLNGIVHLRLDITAHTYVN